MNLLKEFQSFVQNNSLFEPKHKLLIAVSGGVDSMVLMQLLHSNKYQISCAHVNFKLRGEESDADATFVEEYCLKNNIPYFYKTFNTIAFKKENGLGTQEAARILRYQWFNELVQTESFDYLLTAHHANDQAETILFNLIRGTGVRGLSGIAVKNEKIVRPLLFAKKQDIINYANQQHIAYRKDASNESVDYSRNFIRHHILPNILKVQSGFVEHTQHHSKLMEATHLYYQERIKEIEKEISEPNSANYVLKTDKLIHLKHAEFVLFELIQKFSFNFNQCEQIIEAAAKNHTGAQFISNTHRLLIDRIKIIIQKIGEEKIYFSINELPTICELNHIKYKFSLESFSGFESNTWWLDFDKISLPFTIRSWQIGDKFSPLGLNRRQKLSDFFTNRKLNLFQKEQAWVLESNNEICLVGTYQVSDTCKITDATKNYLRIKAL